MPDGFWRCAMDDEAFMKLALELAGEAARAGEVPVGCVITRDGRVVGRGRNRREGARNALCHGELELSADADAADIPYKSFRSGFSVTG